MTERWKVRRIDKRDWFMQWTNPRALRLDGYRMGPNRMKRMRRVQETLHRHVNMKLKQMGY